jgi:radical SAM superfamily enzyme YgiQ (UPF0313 family)
MKISISFPPFESSKGVPLLSQNRQFQWFNAPTYIYPMVPASLATLLSESGHEVIWDDGIAQELNFEEWFSRAISENPDMMVIESKTPVIKFHWEMINKLKDRLPHLKVVLCGDHVTALPEESLRKSKVDYIMIGGDYDFIGKSLVDFLENGGAIPKGLAHLVDGKFETGGYFDTEVSPYTMFGRDCWWRKNGGCTFCSWTNTYRKFRQISVKKALEEVEHLYKLGVKEIFDDTGSFPIGNFLKEFCEGVISRGLHKKMTFGCNMRPDALSLAEYKLLKKANFRLVLFGLESANQNTLDRVNKGTTVEKIVAGLKRASQAGLEVHVTTMIGYPWETKKEAENTINLAQDLFKKGHTSTLQATVVIPYPGTALYKECIENNWLRFKEYERFDQREQVMTSELETTDVLSLTQGLYKSFLTPRFIIRKILSIRSYQDVKFYFMAACRVLAHLKDFSSKSA